MSYVPTQSELEQTLVDIADLGKELHLFGGSNTENVAALVDTIIDNGSWPGAAPITSRSVALRFGLSESLRGYLRRSFDDLFRGYLNLADSEFDPDNPAAGWEDVFAYFHANTRRVLSRAPTFDTSVTKSGTGDPTWRRLTTCPAGYAIESAWFDDIVGECIRDRMMGAPLGQEQIRMTMPRAIDLFSLLIAGEEDGAGTTGLITPNNGDAEGLQDLSFECNRTEADSDPSDLGAWLDSAGTYGSAKYAIVKDGYRLSVREALLGDVFNPGTKLCLQIKGDHTIHQEIKNLDRLNPYDWCLFAKKAANATGALTMTVGSNASATVDISTLSTSAWTLIGPTLNKNLWPDNFSSATPRLSIAVSNLEESVYIDAVSFRKMDRYNGTFWHVVPGATAMQRGYTATFNDTISSDSVIQRLLFFAYGLELSPRGVGYFLPHTASGTPPEITDP